MKNDELLHDADLDCPHCGASGTGNGYDPDEGCQEYYECGSFDHPMAGMTRSDECRRREAAEDAKNERNAKSLQAMFPGDVYSPGPGGCLIFLIGAVVVLVFT